MGVIQHHKYNTNLCTTYMGLTILRWGYNTLYAFLYPLPVSLAVTVHGYGYGYRKLYPRCTHEHDGISWSWFLTPSRSHGNSVTIQGAPYNYFLFFQKRKLAISEQSPNHNMDNACHLFSYQTPSQPLSSPPLGRPASLWESRHAPDDPQYSQPCELSVFATVQCDETLCKQRRESYEDEEKKRDIYHDTI